MANDSTPRPNTHGIRTYAQHKAEAARLRVDQAITALVQEMQVINFNTVAKRAGVTKSYLYAQAPLREHIEALRQQQNGVTLPQRRTEAAAKRTDATKDILLAAKERRIRELEDQNRQLREQLKVAYGKLYEQI